MEERQEHSLSNRVFLKIRDNILNGTYKEQDELRENTIGKELGVSRTPVREALRQLELEGLVTIVPNKGAYVTGITTKDVKDIYTVRSMWRNFVLVGQQSTSPKNNWMNLKKIIFLSEFHMKKEGHNNTEQIAILDGRFHAVLYEASNSRILGHVLTDFHRYVQMARKSSIVSEERARKSIREHKQILRGMGIQCSLAEQLANEHILHVIQNLQRQGFGQT